MLGVSESFNTVVAFCSIIVALFGSRVGVISCVGFGNMFLVVFLRVVRRFICLVSALVMGGYKLVCVALGVSVVIGQISCARRWNSFIVSITFLAAMSI